MLNPAEPTAESIANRGDCSIGQILDLEYDSAVGKTKRIKTDIIKPYKSYLIYIDPPEDGSTMDYCTLAKSP